MITRQTLINAGAAILGTALVLAGWHLYTDHQNLHALVSMVQQARQAQHEAEKK